MGGPLHGELTNPDRKKQNITKCCIKPQSWRDYLKEDFQWRALVKLLMKLLKAKDRDGEFPDEFTNYQLLNHTIPL
jgi:hypothetical protein